MKHNSMSRISSVVLLLSFVLGYVLAAPRLFMTPANGTPAPAANSLVRRSMGDAAPVSQRMDRSLPPERAPTEEQLARIRQHLRNRPPGEAFTLHNDGRFEPRVKTPHQMAHYGDKSLVFNTEDELLYKTPCCGCHKGTCGECGTVACLMCADVLLDLPLCM
jgi:hypothetical protein